MRSLHWFVGITCIPLLLCSCNNNLDGTALPAQVDYNLHVRPVLSDKCFSCHGPDERKREAGLRLDLAEAAYAEIPDSPGTYAIVPGKPARSQLVQRINHPDVEQRMPPVEAKMELSEAEKQLLERWIRQGAEYKPHWALIPLEVPVSSQEKKRHQKKNIDHFISGRLNKEGLQMAPSASKEELIRRAAFDLTGLPPTLDEIDAFTADSGDNAFEKVIDQYLASPAYGERMAVWWMDIARYADSDGYLDDKHRDFSPWRDWVIQAFNTNVPYNEFVTWQLAGDLLPGATQEQVLATAFNRLHKKNSEAGIVFEEFRTEYVADRTNTFGKAFLGVTLECARCHDHKYDPVSQREYYQLFAFFNNTHEIGHAVYGPDQTPGPALLLTSDEQQTTIDSLTAHEQLLEEELNKASRLALPHFTQWAVNPLDSSELALNIDQSQVAFYTFDQIKPTDARNAESVDISGKSGPAVLRDPEVVAGIKGNALSLNDYNTIVLGKDVGWYDRTDPFSISLWIQADTVYEDAMLFTHSEEWRLGLRGYTLHLEDNYLVFRMAHSYPQNALHVTATTRVPVRSWSHIGITYDGSSKASGIQLYLNGAPLSTTVQEDNLYKGILFTPDIHTYGFKGIQLGHRDKFTPFKGGSIDEFRVFDRQLAAVEMAYLHSPEATQYGLMRHASTPDSLSNPNFLFDYYLAHHDSATSALSISLKETRDSLNAQLNRVPEIMVMGDLENGRDTHILERGMYNLPSEKVIPGTPSAILVFGEEASSDRLGLARWLFDEKNPLTARVIVNRIWTMHFGRGLVTTLDDFGNQGEMPSHPELLDWLAVEFMASGWDLKALHKSIMLSATYQQHAAVSPEILEKDPDNRLLARGASFRLPAEMIRDNALAISGLLAPKIGGPAVYPYQPAGLWDELSTKGWRYTYLQEPGEGLYRRSLYTVWKRTSPPPSMLIFDAPDRSTCEVDRTETSTPLQALVLLNDTQYIEAARKLAERVIKQHPDDMDAQRITLFRYVMGRHPSPEEQTMLQEFFEVEYASFQADDERARLYLLNGEAPADKTMNPAQVSTLAVIANALMNTDEAYTRR